MTIRKHLTDAGFDAGAQTIHYRLSKTEPGDAGARSINSTPRRRIVRRLTHDVGIDRTTDQPTNVYTVITKKSNGDVVTMFPGTV